MRIFRREPIVYDLWADIRLFWRMLDYYEKAWMETLKQSWMNAANLGTSEQRVKLYPYELGR